MDSGETDNKVEAAVEHLRRTVEGGSHLMPEDQVNVPIGVLRALISSKEAAEQRCDRLAAENAQLKALYEHSCAVQAECKDDVEAAEAKLSALVEELTKADECFEAAYAEGLLDVLAASDDANLCDLVNRRILMAREPIWRALASLDRTAPEEPEPVVLFPEDGVEYGGLYVPEPAQEVAGLVEKVARIIDPEAWAEHDAQKAETAPYRGPIRLIAERVVEGSAAKAEAILTALASSPSQGGETFQARVQPWMLACFNPEIAADKLERNDRFIEEALELVQASAYPKERAHALVEYVYGRPQGDINQEVGGVMVTLAAHCLAHGVDMHEAGEAELARINQPDIIVKIRAKQAAKPKGSALPIAVDANPLPDVSGLVDRSGVAAADDNHKALVEIAREIDAEADNISPLNSVHPAGTMRNWATRIRDAAFQSRKEESR